MSGAGRKRKQKRSRDIADLEGGEDAAPPAKRGRPEPQHRDSAHVQRINASLSLIRKGKMGFTEAEPLSLVGVFAEAPMWDNLARYLSAGDLLALVGTNSCLYALVSGMPVITSLWAGYRSLAIAKLVVAMRSAPPKLRTELAKTTEVVRKLPPTKAVEFADDALVGLGAAPDAAEVRALAAAQFEAWVGTPKHIPWTLIPYPWRMSNLVAMDGLPNVMRDLGYSGPLPRAGYAGPPPPAAAAADGEGDAKVRKRTSRKQKRIYSCNDEEAAMVALRALAGSRAAVGLAAAAMMSKLVDPDPGARLRAWLRDRGVVELEAGEAGEAPARWGRRKQPPWSALRDAQKDLMAQWGEACDLGGGMKVVYTLWRVPVARRDQTPLAEKQEAKLKRVEAAAAAVREQIREQLAWTAAQDRIYGAPSKANGGGRQVEPYEYLHKLHCAARAQQGARMLWAPKAVAFLRDLEASPGEALQELYLRLQVQRPKVLSWVMDGVNVPPPPGEVRLRGYVTLVEAIVDALEREAGVLDPATVDP